MRNIFSPMGRVHRHVTRSELATFAAEHYLEARAIAKTRNDAATAHMLMVDIVTFNGSELDGATEPPVTMEIVDVARLARASFMTLDDRRKEAEARAATTAGALADAEKRIAKLEEELRSARDHHTGYQHAVEDIVAQLAEAR